VTKLSRSKADDPRLTPRGCVTDDGAPRAASPGRRLALWVLAAFVLTFMAARVVVYLVMARVIPDLYLYIGGTHVHHLNYGIFLLSAVGAYLIFQQPGGRALAGAAAVYGVGLGLTFDEFGIWLHLGGGYWQRASFDAVVVVAGILGLIVVAPSVRRFRPRHWTLAAVLLVAVLLFAVLAVRSLRFAENVLGPRLERLETGSPP